jgi:hypothetical protein
MGGMGAITAAMAEACRSKGVELRTGAEVSGIRVSGGRAQGVTLADGSTIDSCIVVSNADPKRTYLGLVPAGEGETITTESGLQYEVLTMGEGPRPADTSTVTVNYEGSLIDGEVFDSSYESGEPVSFPLNGVIAGWTEGLQLMPLGSTFKFYIPSSLGYGPRESGPIPGNSVLVFKVELLEIAE